MRSKLDKIYKLIQKCKKEYKQSDKYKNTGLECQLQIASLMIRNAIDSTQGSDCGIQSSERKYAK